MEDPYRTYPKTYRDRTFIGDWLFERPLEDECVADVASKARQGDEGAVIALLRIEGNPSSHASTAKTSEDILTETIDCLRIGCNGCVKLLLDGTAGIETTNCAVQANQSQPEQQ